MADFFVYNKSSELIEDKLSKAEQNVYREIRKLASAVKSNTVFATIDYLIKHTPFNSKGSISNALNGLIDKGLLVRELVQSNKSRHKCYQYYLVSDLRCTKLFQSLPEEEQQKYLITVKADAEPYTQLTAEENKLYCYLKFTVGIKDLTHRKLHILIDCANNNAAIETGSEIETITLMAKHCMDAKIINKFGYLKKTIQNYSLEPKATYTPMPKETETLTDEQERLYSACNNLRVILSPKQVKAIVSVANSLKIDVDKVIGIISDVVHVKGIRDVFKYIIKSIHNYKHKTENKSSYAGYTDLADFEKMLIEQTKAEIKQMRKQE